MMLIRQLRENEAHKSAALMAAAFGFNTNIDEKREEKLDEEFWGAFDDDGETLMAQIAAKDYRSYLGGKALGTLGIAGVSTLPEYRRNGCIRAVFARLFQMAPERGWALSMLYPFSYEYYRKFGYERICDKVSLALPIRQLSAIKRDGSGILCVEKAQGELLRGIYDRTARRFNGMLVRTDNSAWSFSPYGSGAYTYLFMQNDVPCACATYRVSGNTLVISSIYCDVFEDMERIVGFARNYDGQVQNVRFEGLTELAPALTMMLGEERGFSFDVCGGPMARVLDVPAALEACADPDASVTLLVRDDQIAENNGTFTLAGGHCERADGRTPELECDIRALTLLAYGAYDRTPEEWRYYGMNVYSADALAAFPRRRIRLDDAF